jgi:hypothetical protein
MHIDKTLAPAHIDLQAQSGSTNNFLFNAHIHGIQLMTTKT